MNLISEHDAGGMAAESQFGFSGHTPAGKTGATAYETAKYFRFAGRILVIIGLTLEAWAVVQAHNRLRRASRGENARFAPLPSAEAP